MLPIDKVISGGQTGADRGGLDAALSLGVPIGGHCPKGRRAEDGVIPEIYTLTETASRGYLERTFMNVEDSGGTVVITKPKLDGGSLRTVQHCQALGIPWFHGRVIDPDLETKLRVWLEKTNPRVLNVAGSRESSWPGIQKFVCDLLIRLLST